MNSFAASCLPISMRSVGEALKCDAEGRQKEAYCQYLSSMLFIIQSLKDDAWDKDFQSLELQATKKLFQLLQKCLERSEDIFSSKSNAMSDETSGDNTVNESSGVDSVNVEDSNTTDRQDGPTARRLTYDRKSHLPVPGKESQGSPKNVRSLSDTNVPTPPYPTDNLHHLIMSMPAPPTGKNTEMFLAYQKRKTLRANFAQRRAETDFNLSALRRLEENRIIERAKLQALEQKRRQRRENLQQETEKRFATIQQRGKGNRELQKDIFVKILEFEQEAEWATELRRKLMLNAESTQTINNFVNTILRSRQHPLGKLTAEVQYKVYYLTARAINGYSCRVYSFDDAWNNSNGAFEGSICEKDEISVSLSDTSGAVEKESGHGVKGDQTTEDIDGTFTSYPSESTVDLQEDSQGSTFLEVPSKTTEACSSRTSSCGCDTEDSFEKAYSDLEDMILNDQSFDLVPKTDDIETKTTEMRDKAGSSNESSGNIRNVDDIGEDPKSKENLSETADVNNKTDLSASVDDDVVVEVEVSNDSLEDTPIKPQTCGLQDEPVSEGECDTPSRETQGDVDQIDKSGNLIVTEQSNDDQIDDSVNERTDLPTPTPCVSEQENNFGFRDVQNNGTQSDLEHRSSLESTQSIDDVAGIIPSVSNESAADYSSLHERENQGGTRTNSDTTENSGTLHSPSASFSESTKERFYVVVSHEALEEIVKEVQLSLDLLYSMLTITYRELDTPTGQDQSYATLESVFFEPVWPWLNLLFRNYNEEKEVKLFQVMKEKRFSSLKDFSVREKFWLDETVHEAESFPYSDAIEELRILPTYLSPLDKLECAVRAFRKICQCVDNYWERVKGTKAPSLGCDDLLPILTYVLVKAEKPQIASECHALDEFIHESYLMGEEGYCLTTLQMAVTYLITAQNDTKQTRDESLSNALDVDDKNT